MKPTVKCYLRFMPDEHIMQRTNLDKVLSEVRTLTADELERVRITVEALLNSQNGAKLEDKLELMLLEDGLLSEIPSPKADPRPYEPIEFKGQPVSETIIEERL